MYYACFIHYCTSLCTVIDSPSDVTACFRREARFSCFVQFTSGTPSGASWFQDSGTNASTLPNHVLFDNSSSSSILPAIVNNTLLITNISFDVESGRTYFCQQGNETSDTATLIIIGELCCCIPIMPLTAGCHGFKSLRITTMHLIYII